MDNRNQNQNQHQNQNQAQNNPQAHQKKDAPSFSQNPRGNKENQLGRNFNAQGNRANKQNGDNH